MPRPVRKENGIRRRINFILLFFLVAGGALSARLFMLQIVAHQDYVKLASRQHRSGGELISNRGSVFVTDKEGHLFPLARNKTWATIAASPAQVEEPEEVASLIAAAFAIPPESLIEKLTKSNDTYEVLVKRVEVEEAKKIRSRQFSGVFVEEERRRVYPQKAVAAHLIGFSSVETTNEAGRYGLERFYESELSGENSFFDSTKDADGFLVALGRRIIQPPKHGADLVLTTDYHIQLKAEEVLQGLMEKWVPASGKILVMDPMTGRVLAMAARPVFDPNEFSKEKDFSVFLNPAAEAAYEFGSVVKPITMAAGIEEKVVRPDSTYEDKGIVQFGRSTIRNFDGRAYGVQTMSQVLEKSLNTGIVHVARLLGKDRHYEYLRRFGLGEQTAIDLPGEVRGSLANLESGRDINFATASFGQGITATPIQLAMALGAIANGGTLMRPYVVEKIKEDSGNEVVYKPRPIRTVISKETSETITKMLISTVRSGFENRAGIKGYFVAGKTGTAQIPKVDGPGYSDKVIHTFVGYAPAFKPKFLVVLQINEPQGNRFAANTLTPAFHNLAAYILNYYEIPPDEPQEKPASVFP